MLTKSTPVGGGPTHRLSSPSTLWGLLPMESKTQLTRSHSREGAYSSWREKEAFKRERKEECIWAAGREQCIHTGARSCLCTRVLRRLGQMWLAACMESGFCRPASGEPGPRQTRRRAQATACPSLPLGVGCLRRQSVLFISAAPTVTTGTVIGPYWKLSN